VNYSKTLIASVALFLAQGSVPSYAGFSSHVVYLLKKNASFALWTPVYPTIRAYGSGFINHPVRTTLLLPVSIPISILGESFMFTPRLIHLPWTPKTIQEYRKAKQRLAPIVWAYHSGIDALHGELRRGHALNIEIPTWDGDDTETISLIQSSDTVKSYGEMIDSVDAAISRRKQAKAIASIKKKLGEDVSDIDLALALFKIDEETNFRTDDNKVLSRKNLIEKLRQILPEIQSLGSGESDLAAEALKSFMLDVLKVGQTIEKKFKKIKKKAKHLLDVSDSESESSSSSASSSSASSSDSEDDVATDAESNQSLNEDFLKRTEREYVMHLRNMEEVLEIEGTKDLSPSEAAAKSKIEAILSSKSAKKALAQASKEN
jgi:hypothetical protein